MSDRDPVEVCPHCQGRDLFATEVEPDFLPGLGSWFTSAKLRVVVCAGCGHTQLFVSPEARQKLASSRHWRRLHETPRPPTVPEDTCLRCGQRMPENVLTCANCGWSFEVGEPASS
jgi:hypothetical protein